MAKLSVTVRLSSRGKDTAKISRVEQLEVLKERWVPVFRTKAGLKACLARGLGLVVDTFASHPPTSDELVSIMWKT